MKQFDKVRYGALFIYFGYLMISIYMVGQFIVADKHFLMIMILIQNVLILPIVDMMIKKGKILGIEKGVETE